MTLDFMNPKHRRFMIEMASLRPIEQLVLAARWYKEQYTTAPEFLAQVKYTMQNDGFEDWLDDQASIDILADTLRRM